jgi:hypothetical protein
MWDKRDIWDDRPDRLLPLVIGGIVVTFLFAASWYTNGLRMTLVFLLTMLVMWVAAVLTLTIGWITIHLVGKLLDRRRQRS